MPHLPSAPLALGVEARTACFKPSFPPSLLQAVLPAAGPFPRAAGAIPRLQPGQRSRYLALGIAARGAGPAARGHGNGAGHAGSCSSAGRGTVAPAPLPPTQGGAVYRLQLGPARSPFCGTRRWLGF